MAAGEAAPTVRRAKPGDVEAILDLLTHYDLPRDHFEALYYDDPTYRPEHSWVVDRNGKLLAHLRVFYRSIRVAGHPLGVAGIGNVVTARDERGRGHAARLLEGTLDALSSEQVPYSFLWTHVPGVYARHGWVPIREELVKGHAESLSSHASTYTIKPFEPADLPEVMALYEATNARRTGPVVRSEEYWKAQRAWLREDADDFLVARDETGSLAAYLRSREGPEGIEIRELAVEPRHLNDAKELLNHLGSQQPGTISGTLPASLFGLFSPDQREVVPDPGLMGRVVNLDKFVDVLALLLSSRVPVNCQVLVSLSTAAGSGMLKVTGQEATLLEQQQDSGVPELDEEKLADLLFHGYQEHAGEPLQEDLKMLFPPQDFVIWGTDRF